MSIEELRRRLAAGRIARLSEADWTRLSAHFQVVADHDTRLAGPLLIVRWSGQAGEKAKGKKAGAPAWAAVERPAPGERVVRPLAGEKAADEFVRARLATYDRMWDGCGCKVDYYG